MPTAWKPTDAETVRRTRFAEEVKRRQISVDTLVGIAGCSRASIFAWLRGTTPLPGSPASVDRLEAHLAALPPPPPPRPPAADGDPSWALACQRAPLPTPGSVAAKTASEIAAMLPAAQQAIWESLNGQSTTRVRYDAAKLVLEHTIGKPKNEDPELVAPGGAEGLEAKLASVARRQAEARGERFDAAAKKLGELLGEKSAAAIEILKEAMGVT
jgi:hypothetical protein